MEFPARGICHYPVLDDFDTYVGLLLGYNIRIASSFGTNSGIDPDGGSIAYSGFVGGRYYVSDSFSIFGELGYGISVLRIGVGVKL